MRKLEQFVMVARTGSIGKAALALGLSQPTLTRSMRALEQELGARLFERGPLGTAITQAGERFLPRAQELLNNIERAIAELDEEGAQAQLKLGISPNFHFDLLPRAIDRLIAEEPLLNILLVSATRERIAADLVSNAIDIGLCLLPQYFYTDTSETTEIDFEPIGEEQVRPYARPGHPHAGVRALDQTTGIRWAVPHQLSVTYRFESAFYRNHLPVPPQSLNASSLSLLRGAAMHGQVVALLPARLVADDVREGRLVELALPMLHFDYVYGFMEKKGRKPNRTIAAFKTILRAQIGA